MQSQENKIYYGWKIIIVAFLVDFIAVGFFFYSYGVFFKALAVEFGGSRLDVSIGITLVNIVGALIAPTLGRALDKFPIKNVMLFGCLNMSFGFLLLSFINNQWQLYLILATFIAVGAAAMGGLPTAKLVTNWFVKKRGTALGIATMGISLSGVLMPILSAALIDTYGWRTGFLVFGVVSFSLVMPIVIRYVVDLPSDLGLFPDNKKMVGSISAIHINKVAIQWKTKDAIVNHDFWLIVLTFGFLFCCMGATLTHMVPRVTDMGFSLSDAAQVLSIGAGTGVLGKVIYGWITDKYNAKRAIWLAIVFQFSGQLMLLSADSYTGLLIGSATFGFGMGGIVPIHGSMVSSRFGQEGFGFMMGLMRPAMMPIMVTGIPFAGWVFDTMGTYDFAFKTFLLLYVLAAITVYFVSDVDAGT
ncbi:MAG: MFS family permease [Candidatus Azotimanducaceae bacterium]